MDAADQMAMRTLANRYAVVTGRPVDVVKPALWVEYLEGGVDGARAFVERGLSDMRLLALAESMAEAGHDPLGAIDALYEARSRGGMESVASSPPRAPTLF